jgi:hypothetical protein
MTHFRDVPLFRLQRQNAGDRGIGVDGRTGDRTRQLLQRQVLAQLGFETGRRHALGTQGGLVAFVGETAVDIEGLDAKDGLADRLVADEHPVLVRFEHQQALVDQVIEDGLARFRRLEQLGIVLVAELCAQAVLLIAQRFLELLLVDLQIADFCHVSGRTRVTDIGLEAEESEGDGDQTKNGLGDDLVIADCVEHEEKVLRGRSGRQRRTCQKSAMIP